MKVKSVIFALIIVALTVFPAFGQGSGKRLSAPGIGCSEKLKSLLPKDTEMKGWAATWGPQLFDRRNLWEHIDGQAEMYLDYGFACVVTVEYAASGGHGSMTIEVYQMQSPKQAFGIYAAERSPTDTLVRVGVQGYLSENVLNFWKGPYYVKLSSSTSSRDTKELLMRLSAGIDGRIRSSYSDPELFDCFPVNDRIKMSERFIPKNFLGLSFLKDGYRVGYESGGCTYQVFLVDNGSQNAARDVFQKYEDFLVSQHHNILHTSTSAYPLIHTTGKKLQVIFLYGPFVGGVLNIGELARAEQIIKEIVQKLN